MCRVKGLHRAFRGWDIGSPGRRVSHIRLTLEAPPQHHLTIPAQAELNPGTLAAILSLASQRLPIGKEDLLKVLKL